MSIRPRVEPLAVAIAYATAGVGASVLAAIVIWRDHRTDVIALRAALAFGLAWVALHPSVTRMALDSLLESIVVSMVPLMFFAAVTRSVISSGVWPALLRSPLLLLACGLSGSFWMFVKSKRVDRTGPLLSGRRLAVLPVKFAVVCLASAAFGAGVGFIEGVVWNPRSGANVFHDGAAGFGALVACACGPIIRFRMISPSASAVAGARIVLGSLVAGLLTAWPIGFPAMIVTPLAAFALAATTPRQNEQ
jgi:hypothetical protein